MHRLRAILLLLATMLVWGTTFHLARFALQSFSPYSLAAARFALGAVILLILAGKRSDLHLLRSPAFLGRMFFLGVIGIFFYNIFFYQGIARVNPAKAALIAAANPGITALLLRIWKKESLAPAVVLGIGIAFLGVGLVILGPLSSDRVDLAPGWGDLLLLVAVTSWAVYSIFSRDFARTYTMRPVTLYALVLGSPALAVPALIEGHGLPTAVGPWLAVIYMAAFATALAYLWWGQGVEILGPAATAVFLNLVPVTAFAIEYALGGALHPLQIGGGMLILTGVYLTSRPRPT